MKYILALAIILYMGMELVEFQVAIQQMQLVRERQKERCMTGVFLVDSPEGGLVAIGEQQVCGKDLHWSGVYAPNIESWRKSQPTSLPPPQNVPLETTPEKRD